MGKYYNFIYLLLIFSVILLFHSVSGEIPAIFTAGAEQRDSSTWLGFYGTGELCPAERRGDSRYSQEIQRNSQWMEVWGNFLLL